MRAEQRVIDAVIRAAQTPGSVLRQELASRFPTQPLARRADPCELGTPEATPRAQPEAAPQGRLSK